MAIAFQGLDWTAVAKIYGPLGVTCLLLVLAVWKILLPWIQKQQATAEANLKEQIQEARSERDYVRQMREAEVNKFLDSLKLRDEKMERALNGVAEAIRGKR